MRSGTNAALSACGALYVLHVADVGGKCGCGRRMSHWEGRGRSSYFALLFLHHISEVLYLLRICPMRVEEASVGNEYATARA